MTCRATPARAPSRACSSLSVGVAAQTPSGAVYRPALKPPEFLEPFAPKVDAGHDAFVDEPIAEAIEAQLRRFGDALKSGPAPAAAAASWLLAPGARGSALVPPQRPTGDAALQVLRWSGPAAANVDARGLAAELRRLSEALGTVVTTEFQVTAIDARPMPPASCPSMSASISSARDRARSGSSRPGRGRCDGARTPKARGRSSSGRRPTR